MSIHADRFNALPIEIRTICCASSLEDQIRDLIIEKQRAIKHHRNHIREINAHLKNCQHDLKKFENEGAK